jgi:DhnA family fructose-bisphosphate aldolase class Ia
METRIQAIKAGWCKQCKKKVGLVQCPLPALCQGGQGNKNAAEMQKKSARVSADGAPGLICV